MNKIRFIKVAGTPRQSNNSSTKMEEPLDFDTVADARLYLRGCCAPDKPAWARIYYVDYTKELTDLTADGIIDVLEKEEV